MTRPLTNVAATAHVLPPQPTRAQLLESVARIVKVAPGTYRTLRNVEETDPDVPRGLSTAGTIFEPIRDALGRSGIETKPTVGSVMDALDLTQGNVNFLACHCHNGTAMTGEMAATRLEAIAQGPGPRPVATANISPRASDRIVRGIAGV